ncbi:hypothetical protein Tco_1088321 [Tanacetum coccineum]
MINFSTFSTPLFDDSSFSDDESSHEEVIHEMSFKTYSNPLFDLNEEIISSEFNSIHNEDLDSTPKDVRFDAESYLLESLVNRDTLMASPPKIDFLLDEFADRANPRGIARDVFVPVGKFTFLADFVIVDYESDPRVPLILGRPFLRTAHTVNDDTYDDPFDFKEEKIKDSKILINELDLPESSDFLPFPKCDSVFYEDFSEVDALSSTNNEDKVFNPGILIHENLFEVTNFATPDKNVKKTTNASLILEDFNRHIYELPFHKEVSGLRILLSNYLIGALKLSKSPKFLKARWRFFLALTKRTSESWMFRVSTSIPLDKLKYGGLGQAK